LLRTSCPLYAAPSRAVHVLRACFRARSIFHLNADAQKVSVATKVLGGGIGVLVCLTTWMIASIFAGMVPVYLALIILIFVTPRRQSNLLRRSTWRAQPVGSKNHGWLSEAKSANAGEKGGLQFDARSSTNLSSDKSTGDPTNPKPSPSAPAAVKQPRGHTRVRRAGKSSAEASLTPTAAVWIRVGPGKFVRADGTPPPVEYDQSCVQEAPASTDSSASVSDSEHADTFAPESDVATNGSLRSTETDPVQAAEPCESTLPGTRKTWGSSGTGQRIHCARRTYRRCVVEPGHRRRTLVWSLVRSNRLPKQSIRRALGRGVWLPRTLRPRSPPHTRIR